jgi:putative FmdB family regulatory protein
MPIYEYHCKKCEGDFEELVFGNDEPGECPSCGSKKISRLASACSFVSKGSSGETTGSSAGSSCNGCTANSCASCGN